MLSEKDPRDRSNGPGAWPTLRRSVNMTDLTGDVHVSDRPSMPPTPKPGCDVCASLGRQREQARRIGDMSTVTDCNVEINRHPHGKRGAK
jgi:hypothetical protein